MASAASSTDSPLTVYRGTSLGTALTDSLTELVQDQQITPELMNKTLEQFERSFNAEMGKLKTRATFSADCDRYKHLQDLWIIHLRNMQIECENETIALDQLCVMATKSHGER